MSGFFQFPFRMTNKFSIMTGTKSFGVTWFSTHPAWSAQFVMRVMFFLVSANNEVFWTVIAPLSIYMVNHLTLVKQSSDYFFHHNPVFLNVSIFCIWMFCHSKKHIPVLCYSSALPILKQLPILHSPFSKTISASTNSVWKITRLEDLFTAIGTCCVPIRIIEFSHGDMYENTESTYVSTF